jgi:hypothetical protein
MLHGESMIRFALYAFVALVAGASRACRRRSGTALRGEAGRGW